MLRPSYSELIDHLNAGDTVDNKITSRYTIVLAAAKRARQLINGDKNLVDVELDKAVSIAVKELNEGKLHIVAMKESEAELGNETAKGVGYGTLYEDFDE